MKVKSISVLEKTADQRSAKTGRNRIKYTDVELTCLERVFHHTQYPDTNTMEDLSENLRINSERLSIWFQNRRSKFKRQSKDGYVSWMRNQLYASPPAESVDLKSGDSHVLSSLSQEPRRDPVLNRPSSNLHYMPPVYMPYAIPGYNQTRDVRGPAHSTCRFQSSHVATSPDMSTNERESHSSNALADKHFETGLSVPTSNIFSSSVHVPHSSSSLLKRDSEILTSQAQSRSATCTSSTRVQSSYFFSDLDFQYPASIPSLHTNVADSLNLCATSLEQHPPVRFDMPSTSTSDLTVNDGFYRQQTAYS